MSTFLKLYAMWFLALSAPVCLGNSRLLFNFNICLIETADPGFADFLLGFQPSMERLLSVRTEPDSLLSALRSSFVGQYHFENHTQSLKGPMQALNGRALKKSMDHFEMLYRAMGGTKSALGEAHSRFMETLGVHSSYVDLLAKYEEKVELLAKSLERSIPLWAFHSNFEHPSIVLMEVEDLLLRDDEEQFLKPESFTWAESSTRSYGLSHSNFSINREVVATINKMFHAKVNLVLVSDKSSDVAAEYRKTLARHGLDQLEMKFYDGRLSPFLVQLAKDGNVTGSGEFRTTRGVPALVIGYVGRSHLEATNTGMVFPAPKLPRINAISSTP